MAEIKDLFDIALERKKYPKENGYTTYLYREGTDKICKKIGEEATELVIAIKNDDKVEIVNEATDLLYHMAVLLCNSNITYDDIVAEVARRQKDE